MNKPNPTNAIRDGADVIDRLLTPDEAARLMFVHESFNRDLDAWYRGIVTDAEMLVTLRTYAKTLFTFRQIIENGAAET